MGTNDTAILIDALRVYRGRLQDDLADFSREYYPRAISLSEDLRKALQTVDRLIGELS